MIYDFYDKLTTIFDVNPDLNPDNIWNYNESGFPTDPGKSIVIAQGNKPGFKLPYGACSLQMLKVLDPLIIFQGKNFQSLWHGDMALPITFYGITVNLWREADVFADC